MRWLLYIAVVLGICRLAHADDDPKPEDLKKMYAATLEQLKDAQNRKTQLAAENADLEKQLAAANAQLATLKQQVSQFDAQTYFLRAQVRQWAQFIQENALVRLEWDLFLKNPAPLKNPALIELDDPNWPLSDDRSQAR